MEIGKYSYDEYLDQIKSFHGHVAPGLVLGGFMVKLAQENLPEDILYDIICETGKCLPDAVHLLTPCTIGNGWLKIVNLGKFAMAFYNKYTGIGVRVSIDTDKLEKWPEVKTWFLKLKPKKEQDSDLLYRQMREAGTDLFKLEEIKVQSEYIEKKKMGKNSLCTVCGEYFPASHGMVCIGCVENLPYK